MPQPCSFAVGSVYLHWSCAPSEPPDPERTFFDQQHRRTYGYARTLILCRTQLRNPRGRGFRSARRLVVDSRKVSFNSALGFRSWRLADYPWSELSAGARDTESLM